MYNTRITRVLPDLAYLVIMGIWQRQGNIVTSPAEGIAGAPIAASEAVAATTTISAGPRNTPWACAMNNAVVASYRAIPFILIAIPNGRKKEIMVGSHPASLETMEAANGNTSIFNDGSINSPGKPINKMVIEDRLAGRSKKPIKIPATTPTRVNNNL